MALPAGAAGGAGGRAHEASKAAVAIINAIGQDGGRRVKPPFFALQETTMTLLILEALGAMMLLVFIVWWTMFSGRKKGELKNTSEASKPAGSASAKASEKATIKPGVPK